jgi:hypothetical protein
MILLCSAHAVAATAVSTMSATVIAALSISTNSHLNFGQATAGDAAKTIAAGDTASASFTVSGEANKTYTIVLPTNGSVTMTTGGGGTASKMIAVTSFTSSPSTTGSLGAGGTQTLRVGATRAALPASQASGSYSGSFTVTVLY